MTAHALIGLRERPMHRSRRLSANSALPGGFAIRKRGQGQVIADSRPYISGDDMRHVDRGATARTGELHMRTFHEERDRITFLVADFRPSMLWGMRRAFRSVAAAEALACLGWQAVAAGGRVGLLAITEHTPLIIGTKSGTRGMLAVIGGLVQAHETALDIAIARGGVGFTDPPLDAALIGLRRVVPKGADVVIASALDTLGPEFDAVLGALSQNRKPRFLVIEDGALQGLPAGQYPLRGADGRRRAALFQKTMSVGQDAAERVSDYTFIRVDAGQPPREALAGL